MEKTYVSGRCTISNIGRVIMLSLMLAGVSAIFGQVSVGRISGTVTDSAGAVVPNATVTVTNPATNLSRTATTNDEGF